MGKHAQESYVTGAIDALNTDAIEEGSTNLYFTSQRALDATAATIASASAAAVSSANSYADSAVSGLVDSAPATLNTLNELAEALGDDANFATTVTNSIASKLDASSASTIYSTINSPTFTGTPAAPTAAANTNTTQLATTAFVQSRFSGSTVDTKVASYSLILADAGKTIEMNVGSANNLTIPLNSSQEFPIGTTIDVIQYGAGQTTIVATGGVTVRSKSGNLKLTGQYSGATLYKRGTNEWVVIGDLTT